MLGAIAHITTALILIYFVQNIDRLQNMRQMMLQMQARAPQPGLSRS